MPDRGYRPSDITHEDRRSPEHATHPGESDHSHAHEHEHHHAEGSDRGVRRLLHAFHHAHAHDSGELVDDALAGSLEGIRAVKLSLIGLGVTALLQSVVVLISGSVALLADTIHNLGDAATAIPLWVAFSLSRRPPDRRYTYGYGRAEDLAGVFVVLMIAGSAMLAGWESLRHLIEPRQISDLEWVAIAAVIGFAGNEAVAQYRIRAGRRIGSAALIADGYHARTDGLTSLSVLLGAAGVWLGFERADPLVGLVITAAILAMLKDVGIQIWRRLMDAVEPDLLERAESTASAVEGVQAVTAIRSRWIGHAIHAEATIVADAGVTLNEAHEIAERVRHAMLHAVPRLASVTVHVDPCGHDGRDPHAALAHHDRAYASVVPR